MIKKPVVKQTKKFYIFLVCFGLLLLAGGIIAEALDFDNRLLGFGSGLGCAAIALGVVGMVSLKRKPADARQHAINENDERFIKIREKSAYGTFFVTMISLSVVELVFVWLDYLIPCYIIIGLMAIHVFSYFIFLYLNNKKL